MKANVIQLRIASFTILTALSLGLGQRAFCLESGDTGFGWQWLEEHNFTIMASAEVMDLSTYLGANLTTLMIENGSWAADSMDDCQAHNPVVGYHYQSPTEDADDIVDSLLSIESQLSGNSYTSNVGLRVADEPHRLRMDGIRDAFIEVRNSQSLAADWSDAVLWSTAMGEGASGNYMYYGQSTPPSGSPDMSSYTYQQYLTDFVREMYPDVVVYDLYPFKVDGTTANFYRNMMTVRDVALNTTFTYPAGPRPRPYWAWIQADDERYFLTDGNPTTNPRLRIPSDSDLRLQMFTHLAAGYTGFIYFRYHTGLITEWDEPTPVASDYYDAVTQVNEEVWHLGQQLKSLRNIETKWVSGKLNANTWNPSPEPTLLPVWVADNAVTGRPGFKHIREIYVEINGSEDYGANKNLLVGFFQDPDLSSSDQNFYFMIVNTWNDPNLTGAQTSMTFHIRFDSTISELLHIDRESGQTVHTYLTWLTGPNQYELTVTLPGGTGQLYKFDNGDFPINQ